MLVIVYYKVIFAFDIYIKVLCTYHYVKLLSRRICFVQDMFFLSNSVLLIKINSGEVNSSRSNSSSSSSNIRY